MIDPNLTKLTPQQKLEALSMKFYSGYPWTPKVGDYYTSSRADLELYQIMKIEKGKVHTRYCTDLTCENLATWDEEGFTTEGFGVKRVFVPTCILKIEEQEQPDGNAV